MIHLYTKCGGMGLKVSGEQKRYPKPEFKPSYFEQITPMNKKNAINAIIEIRALWNYVASDAFHNYSHMYYRLLNYPINDELKATFQKDKESLGVYDRKLNAWLIEPSEPPYTYTFCYDGKDFISFAIAKNEQPAPGCRYLLVGKYTKMMQEPNLVTETAAALTSLHPFVMPSINLTVGVPGCGKTRHIIKNHSPGSLVLTSCKEGAEDIRKRMAENNGVPQSNYSRSYRTIDSYLINKRERYSSVWVDEALMEHPGKLFLVCLFSRCRNLYLLGDPNQLGYINRTDVELLYDKSSLFFMPTETLNVSYRCPADVMAILSRKYNYNGEAYSASNVLRSLKCKHFTSLKDVPNMAGTKYLVFKQAEKRQMKEAGYDVSTVHEYQGKEAAQVVLVKTSRNSGESQCESAPHLLVAISRHRESLVYYTPVRDRLKKLMETRFTDEELRSHQKLLLSTYLRPVKYSITVIVEVVQNVIYWFCLIIVWFRIDRTRRNNNRYLD